MELFVSARGNRTSQPGHASRTSSLFQCAPELRSDGALPELILKTIEQNSMISRHHFSMALP
jgi:hypothetical protein